MEKLSQLVIPPNLLLWLCSYLRTVCFSQWKELGTYFSSLWCSTRIGSWPIALSYLHQRPHYVDDICTVLPRDRADHFLSHINGIESTIIFSVELECDGVGCEGMSDTRLFREYNCS